MYRATVSGSFRRHLREVQRALDELSDYQVQVLSPGGTVALGESEGFTFLATDPSLEPDITEAAHLRAIRRSDFLWVVCPDGRIGSSTGLEIGVAVGLGKQIFCRNTWQDDYDGLVIWNKYVQVVHDVPEALRLVETERDQLRKRLAILPGWKTN